MVQISLSNGNYKVNKLGCTEVKLQVLLTFLDMVGARPVDIGDHPEEGWWPHPTVGWWPSYCWLMTILPLVDDHPTVGWWPSYCWWVTFLLMVFDQRVDIRWPSWRHKLTVQVMVVTVLWIVGCHPQDHGWLTWGWCVSYEHYAYLGDDLWTLHLFRWQFMDTTLIWVKDLWTLHLSG